MRGERCENTLEVSGERREIKYEKYMDNSDFYYRKLTVYHKAMQLVANIYQLTSLFPQEEKYGLANQIQRAVVSIPSNIAEGMGRFSNKERTHFLEIANGSLMEVMCQCEVALLLGYISQQQFDEQEIFINDTAKMLIGLRKHFENLV